MLDNDFVKKSFENFAKAVVKQSRSNLTREGHRVSDKLYKSLGDWEVIVSRRGSVSLIFNMEDYGVYQDRGVKGSDPQKSHKMREFTPYKYTTKAPPFKDLRKWVGARRFQFRDRETGRFKSYDETARLIQQSIYKKGIPQTLFFTKPFKRNFGKLPEEILDSFQKDVESWITATFKDKKRFRSAN